MKRKNADHEANQSLLSRRALVVGGLQLVLVGAADSLREGDQRPLLKIKVENTAPFNGEFVRFTSDIDEALEAAETSLAQDNEVETAENE